MAYLPRGVLNLCWACRRPVTQLDGWLDAAHAGPAW